MSSSSPTAAELNARLGIAGVAEIQKGEGGLPMIRVATAAATATISLYGAQVTAWQPTGADEVLFLSRNSRFEPGRAIRGGIPVCFPWFRAKADDPQAPAHGVVRTRVWQLRALEQQGDAVRLVLATESDEQTRRWLPCDFTLEHHITVGERLRLELLATNTGNSCMRMEEALHTYHRVGDAEKVYVEGLDGVTYLDNMDGNRSKVQQASVRFTGQTDNAYLPTRSAPELVDPVLGRRIRTTKENSASTVVWNPWREGAAKLADLGDEEWREMACVEASNIIGEAVELAPGATHRMVASLSVRPL